MNVYVRELVASLAQAGVESTVYVRRWRDDLPRVVTVEPGFRVVHVPAGAESLAKEELPSIVDEFTASLQREGFRSFHVLSTVDLDVHAPLCEIRVQVA